MNSPEPVSREQLLERVWKYEAASETNVVDVYIRYLRGKLDLPHQDSYIKQFVVSDMPCAIDLE